MNATSHPVAAEEVMALVDGELLPEQAQSVSAHLESCVACAALASQFRAVSRSLSEWRVQPVPEKLETRVVDLVGKARSGRRVGYTSLFIRASFWTWWQWALGLCAAAAVGVFLATIAVPNRRSASKEQVSVYSGRRVAPLDSSPFEGHENAIRRVPSSPTGVAGEFAGLAAADHNGPLGNATPDEGIGTGSGAGVGPSAGPQIVPSAQPMIARTVFLSIVVMDFAASRAALETILVRHHSYAAELAANTAQNVAKSLQASLRVPAPELGATITELKSLGSVENETQNGQEVTQQHADLVARLKNSRETEQRLQAILAQRTGKIRDVLEVEREIARVRGEIEQMEAEQSNLEHRVEFATVNLQLTEEYKAQLVSPSPSVSTRVHNALVVGYQKAAETILGFVLFFAEFGPTLVVWLAIIALPVVFLWRRYRRSLATV